MSGARVSPSLPHISQWLRFFTWLERQALSGLRLLFWSLEDRGRKFISERFCYLSSRKEMRAIARQACQRANSPYISCGRLQRLRLTHDLNQHAERLHDDAMQRKQTSSLCFTSLRDFVFGTAALASKPDMYLRCKSQLPATRPGGTSNMKFMMNGALTIGTRDCPTSRWQKTRAK